MKNQFKKQPLNDKLSPRHYLYERKKSLRWGLANMALLAVFAYDLRHKCPYETNVFHYVEYALTTIFGLNTIFHFIRYFYYISYSTPSVINEKPKVQSKPPDNDLSLMIKPTTSPKLSPNKSQNNSGNISKGWLSTSSANDSMNQTMSSPSWVYMKGSSSPLTDYSGMSDKITDELSLQEYLRTIKESEKITALNNSFENSPKDSSGIFWNHPLTRSINDVSPLLKRNLYQLAPLNSELPQIYGTSEEGLPKPSQNLPQAFRRLHLDPQHLTQWNANIRRWITATILENVLKEINQIDESLLKHGLADVRIGYIGLDRLRKIAQNLQIVQQVPTLPILVPFMEISNNQEYLVQRIKELASGGCMSDFKWNGGGSTHSKSWDETLPTDSAVKQLVLNRLSHNDIIMHLFATYLDTQLLPVAQNPEGLPFTTQHFCKVPEKPNKSQDSLMIYQNSINPPHYLLIIGEDTIEVSKGRNNLIHTLLLFLHTLATKHHGMLGRVNLGKSGINILWVIDQ